MKVKIISVRANNNFIAIRIGNQSNKLSANEHLEKEIQSLLDQNPEIEIKHIQYSTTPIIPKTADWETTNSEINWEIEKSVIILFDVKSSQKYLKFPLTPSLSLRERVRERVQNL